MINLITRQFQLLIDGLDCSKALTQFTGGYSHYESQSGLIKIDGSLTLQRTIGWTEDLDDRSNSRWARGKEIKLYIADISGTLKLAPIAGTVYIIESEYDGLNLLQIKFGCRLSLLDAHTPPGKGVCFPIGEATPNNWIVNKLLLEVGISDGFIGSIPGAATVPQNKIDSGSLVALIGQICYAHGRLCYQGNDGKIRIKPINLSPQPHFTRWVNQHAVSFSRLTGAEKPCEKVICSGVKVEAQKPHPKDNWFDWNEEFSKAEFYLPNAYGNVIALKEYREEKINRLNRKIHRKYFVWKPKVELLPYLTTAGLSLWYELKEFIDEEYEPASHEICGIDEGRLKSCQILRYKPFGLALAEWRRNNPDRLFFDTSLILAEKILTFWRYSDGNKPIEKTTLTYLPIAAILPEEENLVLPSSLQLAKRETQSWTKIKEGEWEELDKVEEATALFKPEALEDLEESGRDPSVSNKLALRVRKRDPNRSNSGQSHPPAPDRFPPEAELTETPISGVAHLPSIFGSEFRERERHYQIEAGLLSSEEQAARVAEIEGGILWGRYKGQSFACALYNSLFDVSPLAACHWVEPSGKEYKFLLDGLTFSMVDSRCAIASDGIWMGFVGMNSVQSPIDDPPTPDPDSEIEETIRKPYTKAFSFCAVRGIHSTFDFQAYIAPEPMSFCAIRGLNPLRINSNLTVLVDVEGIVTRGAFVLSTPAIARVNTGSIETKGTLAISQPITVSTDITGIETKGTLAASQPITVSADITGIEAKSTLAISQPITVSADVTGIKAKSALAISQPITVSADVTGIKAKGTLAISQPITVKLEVN